MEDENKYEFPDFSLDDDTEEMTGVPIYRPLPKEEDVFPNWDELPAIPKGLELNEDEGGDCS